MLLTYIIIFAVLLALELIYFRIADKYNIIDKPNQRSSHSTIVLRGGGVIFVLGAWVWAIARMMGTEGCTMGDCYPWFLMGLTLVAGMSFVDDIRSLPDSVRLVGQFVAMAMMFYQLDILHVEMWWVVIVALIVFVGATNIINFMDGINGITGGYAVAVLLPLIVLNGRGAFMEPSLLMVSLLAVAVFCVFNFRPRGKAKCFAGDVGSIGIAFILLFAVGKLILATQDVTWLICLLVYGVDGVLTIVHRIMLHENLGEAHRKHAYQLMANELKMSHVTVSLIYMALQLVISLGMIYVVPDSVGAHWAYFMVCLVVLMVGYVCFMRRYYHLHEEYLASLKK